MDVIAEGVETPQHLALLKQLGCHRYQGYLFSRAVTAIEFLRYAERSSPNSVLAEARPTVSDRGGISAAF